MRVIFSILFGALLSVAATAQDSAFDNRVNLPPINITTAVENALKQNPQAHIAEETVNVSRQDMRSAKADLLPSGTAGYGWGPTENLLILGPGFLYSGMFSGQVNQTVFNLPAAYSYQAAKERLQAAAASGENDNLRIAAQAMASYLDVLKLLMTLGFAKENYFYINSVLNAMKNGDLKSKAKMEDFNLVEGALGTSLSAKHIFVQEEEISELKFYRDVRLSTKQYFLLEPSPIPIPEDADQALKIAATASPGLQAARDRIEASKKDIKSDRAANLPRIDIFANAYSFGRPQGDFPAYYIHGGAGGVAVSYTFDFKKRANTARDKSKEKISEYTYTDQYNNLEVSIRSLYIQIKEREIRLQGLCQGLKERIWTVDTMRRTLIDKVSVQDFLLQKDALFKTAVSLDNEFLSDILDTYNIHVQMGTLRKNLPPAVKPSENPGPNPHITEDQLYTTLLNRCVARKVLDKGL